MTTRLDHPTRPGTPAVPARPRPAAGWCQRIEAATPAHRDRTVDALRAVAIAGVVLGHWLVTALVLDPGTAGRLTDHSPLGQLPLAPVSWLFQSLGLFFFAGGYANARGLDSRGLRAARRKSADAAQRPRQRDYPAFMLSRLRRFLWPVLALAAVWLPAIVLLATVRAPHDTQHVVQELVTDPLWFLGVYLVLTALTPLVRAALRRYGPAIALAPLAVVALTDLWRSAGHPPLPVQLVDVLAGWLIPYALGIALAGGLLAGRRTPHRLLAGGLALGVFLVVVAGYPASAVGVPGDGWSNLNPPSLFAVALAAAQLGTFLLLRPRLAELLRRPRWWGPVAVLNLGAMTVYCWHQSALLLVTFGGLLAGRLPGLHTAPTDLTWLGCRLLWLPVFAAVLAALVALFHRYERKG